MSAMPNITFKFKTAFHILPIPGRIKKPSACFLGMGQHLTGRALDQQWLLHTPIGSSVRRPGAQDLYSVQLIVTGYAKQMALRIKLELKFSNSVCDMEHFLQVEYTQVSMCKTEQHEVLWLKGVGQIQGIS